MNYHQTLRKINAHISLELKKMEETEMAHKPSPEKWSKKETLGHLIDSAYNNHWRFMRATEKNDLIFPGYNQDKWVRRNDYQNRPTSDLILTWEVVNAHICELIVRIPEDVLNRKTTKHNFDLICMHYIQKEESSSLSYLVWDYIDHLEHHISQIIPDYKKQNPAYQNNEILIS
jgi:hypothetical protein